MTVEEDHLRRRWIEEFGEPPALIDAELMRPILEEMGTAEAGS